MRKPFTLLRALRDRKALTFGRRYGILSPEQHMRLGKAQKTLTAAFSAR